MDDVTFIIHTLVRLSLLLALGWVILRLIRNRNPRWSVLLSRCLIFAALLMPLACLCLPVTSLAVLPPVESETADSTETFRENETPVISESVEPEPVVSLQPAPLNFPTVSPEPKQSDAKMASGPSVADIPSDTQAESDLPAAAVTPVESEIRTHSITVRQTASPVPSEISWWLVCWGAVSLLLLLRIGWQIQRVRKLLCYAETAPASLQSECEALAAQFNFNHGPPVRVSPQIEGPCTVGLIQPSILLPVSWVNELSQSERRAILMHELSHVASFDLFWDLLSRLVSAIWWFHPLVWRLTARHRLACEHMSDALAADSIDDIESYRQLLAGWALHRQGAETRASSLAMADRSFLLRRLKWLETPRDFNTLKRSRCYVCLLLAVLLFVGIASVRFSPQVIAQKPDWMPPSRSPKTNRKK